MALGTQRAKGKTGKQDKLKHCDASEEGTDVKKLQRDVKVENRDKMEKKHGGKRSRKLGMKEYMRLKEEKVIKKVQKEVIEEILSEKGWRKKPHRRDDENEYKKFKRLLKKKVEEKLAQCRSEGKRGAVKMGDNNDNVEKMSSGKEEMMGVEEWDTKE